MASNVCLRCLVRPAAARTPLVAAASSRIAPIAPFSTTSQLAAPPRKIPKKTAAGKSSQKQGFLVARRGGKNTTAAANRKDPAAVRAQRKRIVLSNPNALEVAGLKQLTVENVLSSTEGTVLALDNDTIDALRAAEAFKHNQGWNLFRQPSTLVTRATRQVAELVRSISKDKSARRELIVGDKGAGKSILGLQTMAFASQQGWVVIHIPEAQDLVLSHTSYAPLRLPDGRIIYTQPDYTASLLSRIAKANPVLSTLQLTQQHTFPIPIPPNITLTRLAELGASDPSIAPALWTALLSELLQPGRPALYFSLDGLPHICRPTAYLSRDATAVHALDLALIDVFANLLSGATPLPNGGIIHAMDSNSSRPTVPELDARLSRRDEAAFLTPYGEADGRVGALVRAVALRRVAGVSRGEARGVMEYYARSGVMRGVVDEHSVGEAWTLSGGGVLGELESGMTRLRV